MDSRLALWEGLFPLNHPRSRACSPEDHFAFTATSPQGLSYVLQARKVLGIPQLESSTCLLLPSLGDAPDIRQTKIGGVPYRDAYKPWPRNAQGEELIFFGQINFERCGDCLARTLLGPILLIFTDDLYLFSDVYPPFFHFEWVDEVPEANEAPEEFKKRYESKLASIRAKPMKALDKARIRRQQRVYSTLAAELPELAIDLTHLPVPSIEYNRFYFGEPYLLNETHPANDTLLNLDPKQAKAPGVFCLEAGCGQGRSISGLPILAVAVSAWRGPSRSLFLRLRFSAGA